MPTGQVGMAYDLSSHLAHVHLYGRYRYTDYLSCWLSSAQQPAAAGGHGYLGEMVAQTDKLVGVMWRVLHGPMAVQ